MADLKLLQHLIQVKNASGAIKAAPHVMKDLKKHLENLPFDVNQPSMKGVVSTVNMLKGIASLAQQLGGLSQIGQFGNMLGQLQGLAKNLDQAAQLSPQEVAGRLGVEQLTQAVGDAVALGASLMKFDTPEGTSNGSGSASP
jgi:hypothetical protein